MTNSNDFTANRTGIENVILSARDLYERWGGVLGQDPGIREGLEALERKISASRRAMAEFGVVEACRECEESEGGSCCGAGIENKYNPALLVINLLLGVELHPRRKNAGSCYFLGRSGCVLKVRHILCINYLCAKIRNRLQPGRLIELQTITGHEMEAVFSVHEAVKKFMRS